MLKSGDIVYRVNLETKTIDELKVKQIIHYNDSFEFDLKSKNPQCKSNGSYKYYDWCQRDAELSLERRLVFKSLKEASQYINEKIKFLSEELNLFCSLKEQCLEIEREKK